MPQLDTLSFFTQIFWFVIIIVPFYYIMTTTLIPTISNIFKVRSSFKFVKNLAFTMEQTVSLDKLMNDNLSHLKNNSNNNQIKIKNWINTIISKEKEVNFNPGFNTYLSNIGELISKNKF